MSAGNHKTKVFAEIQINHHEIVRVSHSFFKGKHSFHVRIWLMGNDGKYFATKRGVSLPVEQLPKLLKGLRKARETAEDLGLLSKSRTKKNLERHSKKSLERRSKKSSERRSKASSKQRSKKRRRRT